MSGDVMSNRIVSSGPVTLTSRGVQAPPTLSDRVRHSSLIVTGVLRSFTDGRRTLGVGEVLKGSASDVRELRTVELPPFPVGDHPIVVMVARHPSGALRLTTDPRSVDAASVSAILAAMADGLDADG
ncbi:MAG: hypothetical protein ACR2QO_01555 [Acidimicrobiales bacterium]